MKRCALVILFSALIAVSPTAASAATGDSVKGTAEHLGADPPFPVIKVQINARTGQGGDARGHLTAQIETLGVKDRARVVCLSVFGNRATVGTEIVKSNDPALVGQGQLWSVVDNAGGVDRIAGFPITPTPPTACPPLFFDVPVVSGNYVIHDATP